MRIISANLNGIRSAASKGFFGWLAKQGADVVCVQELKAQAADMKPEMCHPDGYHGCFHYAEKKGYSGVGIYSKRPPDRVVEGLGIADIDAKGRYLQADFGNLSVISLYLPSGSSSEARQQGNCGGQKLWGSGLALTHQTPFSPSCVLTARLTVE